MMISHMTASSTTTTSSSNMSTNSTEPKLAFSIDSIVGRNSRSTNDCHSDTDRHSPRVPAMAQHKSRHSPVNCVRSVSPPLISHRMSDHSPQLSRQLSPSNRSAANMSPMSTPSPISVTNGSTPSPYLEPSRASHQFGQQAHSAHHQAMGSSAQLSHQMMMAAAAQHMSPIPQPYHQAVALYPWLFRANPFGNRFHAGPMAGLIPMDGGHPQFSGAHIHPAAIPAFLSPLFRKPKRIRTAFSPNQLLKLEHAFEKNHYVVGAERKDLARSLNLSETQVKVWFQNRRTKHKRQKDENGEPVDESEEEEEDEDEEHESRRKDRNNQNSGVNGNSNN